GDFPCAGTTGYDALWRVGGLFHDPRGALGLTHLWQRRTGDLRPFAEVAAESTEQIISPSLWAEVDRLTGPIPRIRQADTRLWQRRTGDLRPFAEVAAESTEQIISTSLWAEVERLTVLIHGICQADIRLRDTTRRNIQKVIVALLGAMDRYRAYLVPGEPAPGSERAVIEQAAARARTV